MYFTLVPENYETACCSLTLKTLSCYREEGSNKENYLQSNSFLSSFIPQEHVGF